MSKINKKQSAFVESAILSVSADSSSNKYTVVFRAIATQSWYLVYKNSIDILKSFKQGQILNVSLVKFYDSANSSFVQIQNVNTKITNVNFLNYDSQKTIDITVEVDSPTSIASNFNFDSSNTSNKITFTKIGAGSLKSNNNSGSLSKSLKSRIIEENSTEGTLPASAITTGKVLQSFNHNFNDTNVIDFSVQNNVNVSLGLPLKQTNVTDKFYITTAPYLLDTSHPAYQATISTSSNSFIETYDLDNTKILSTPNNIGSISDHIKVTRKVHKEDLDSSIKQKRFEEQFVPFNESDYYFDESDSRKISDFYNQTIDADANKNYNLGEQKQIKIVLDFTGNGEVYNDLHLLNTKFSFIKPDLSKDTNDFLNNNSNKDKIYDTKFFNFLNGETADSYSSHHMPTAYWNKSQNRWSYLDASNEDYLGSKISDGVKTQIPNNFLFDSSGNVLQAYANYLHLNDFSFFHYDKPILTTPGFRNDGSLLSRNNDEQYNKSMIGQITDTYGFPYKSNWQPTNDHLINMGQYLSKDFLLEKIIIKGKYTSKGEMPVKKGNFASGYLQANGSASIDSGSEFNGSYSHKENHGGILSNNITFFLLNEKNNENYFDQKLKIEPMQHYSFLYNTNNNGFWDYLSAVNPQNNDSESIGKSFGNKIDNNPGEFKTYEIYENNVDIISYIVENNKLYSVDKYNNLELDVNGGSSRNPDFDKNRFHYLDSNSSQDDGILVDNLYFKSRSNWNSSYTEDLNNNPNIIAKIKKESEGIFDKSKSRELITYCNMLVLKRHSHSNYNLDQNTLKNIDLLEETTTSASLFSDSSFNINVDSPKDFEIKSFCKNSKYTQNYIDESEYKIKSNFQKDTIPQSLKPASVKIKNQITSPSGKIELFDFYTTSGPNAYETITKVLGNTLSTPASPPTYLNTKTLNFHIKGIPNGKDGTAVPFVEVYFYYENPRDGSNNLIYSDYDDASPSVTGIQIEHFLNYSYASSTIDSSQIITKIGINLRFLDIYLNAGLVDNFITQNLISESNSLSTYQSIRLSDVKIKLGSNSNWNSMSLYKQNRALSLFLYYALSFYPDNITNTTSGQKSGYIAIETSNSSNYLTASQVFPTNENNVFTITNISNNETTLDLNVTSDYGNYLFFTNVDLTSMSFNTLRIHNVSETSLTTTNFIVHSESKGFFQIDAVETYYNSNYILEGKTKGNNNLDIETNRVINTKPLETKIIPSFKSKSGKYLHFENEFNSVQKSNYLLKPTDNMVFGVSSNCNGQIMPTVFKLHDKIEITLIVRDYVDNNLEYQNNLSKSIRKVVLGDNYINKAKHTIYQTKGAYFDNIWNKKSLNNSLEEFKNGKSIIGLNSKKENGTYSGIITLSNESTNQNNKFFKVYKKDTINPSLGNVFKNCLNLKTIKGKNNNEEDVLKIVITETIDASSSINVVNKWHNSYHLIEYSNFFNEETLQNTSFNDSTFSSIENKNNSKIEICYDANAYQVNVNKKENDNIPKNNEGLSSVANINDSINFKNFYKTFKTFCLPSSKLNSYQNGIQINNEESQYVYRDGEKVFTGFVNSEVNIERNDNSTNQKIKILEDTASLQYFDTWHNSIVNVHQKFGISQQNISTDSFNNLEDRFSKQTLNEYANDTEELILKEGFNPQWHLVIELTHSRFNALLNLNNAIPKDYLEKELHVFLHHTAFSGIEPVSKFAKVIRIAEVTAEEGYFIITLAIPLYFWETQEVSDSYLNNSNNILWGRNSQRIHNFYSNSGPAAWYAKLSDGTLIKSTKDVYKPFTNTAEHSNLNTYYANQLSNAFPLISSINNSNGTSSADVHNYKNTNILPYTSSQLKDLSTVAPNNLDLSSNGQTLLTDATDNSTNKLLLKTPFEISLCSFKNLSNNTTPVYSNIDNNIEKIDNHYKTKGFSKFFTKEKFFENDSEQILSRRNNQLQIQDSEENVFLNEKIYRSKIYKKIENDFIETQSFLIYKVTNMITNKAGSVDTEDNPVNQYNIVEIIGSDTDYTLFSLDKINKNDVLLDINNKDIIRIYEEKLLKDNYFSDSIPYFEIDLSTRSSAFSNAGNGIIHLLYSHVKLDSNIFNITQDLNLNVNVKTGNLGVPIYNLTNINEDDYSIFESQEDSISNFFYGISRRSKYKYPVLNLDGFKFGVENGSKQSLKYHYNDDNFGQYSDKIMGSTNCALVKKDASGNSIFTYTIQKKFIDESFKFTSSANAQNTYNKDVYARSTYPYIEDSSNQLSQYYTS